MNSPIEGLWKAAGRLLYSLGVRRPWEITGLTSTSDYLHYLPKATEYRKFAPGSQPVKAIIPHDVPQYVYDIKYFVRDYRRNNKYTARTVTASEPLDTQKMFASAPLKPEDVKTAPYQQVVRGY